MTRWSRIWEILNSNFFIFIMTTAVIGGISFIYTLHENHALKTNEKIERLEQEERDKSTRRKILDAEIVNRLTAYNVELSNNYNNAKTADLVKSIYILDNVDDNKYSTNLLSQFKDQKLRALLFNLASELSGADKTEVTIAFSCLSGMLSTIRKADQAKKEKAQFVEHVKNKFGWLPVINVPIVSAVENTTPIGELEAKTEFIETLHAINLERWGKPISFSANESIINFYNTRKNQHNDKKTISNCSQ